MISIYEQLIIDEGVRLKPYKDTVGKLTIGVGRNLDDVGISMKEAEIMLQNDVDKVIEQLNLFLPWWSKLNQVRREVLINMAFNLGINGLLGFKNTLKFIEVGNYEQAALNMLDSKWASQVKGRAIRLANEMRKG